MAQASEIGARDRGGFAYTREADLLRDFLSRGLVVLSPDQLGVPPELHAAIYEKENAAFRAKTQITASAIPEVLDVLAAPGLVAAVDRLLGPGWAIVPFTHNTPFISGAFDQHWHKDDNGPYNGRWPRHHQAVQLEMLYYPQAVLPDMGPTATLPYSQYWTFNHEENQDNFAGADHLDFNYQLIGMERVPVSGPRSAYDPVAVQAGATDHDVRMREAPTKTGWPLMRQFEAAPLDAGSVLLYSHNLFHRGNHRRDPFENWKANPRFMWRFWLYRTHDPAPSSTDSAWEAPASDPLTGTDLSAVGPDLTAIWTHQHAWSCGRATTPQQADNDSDALEQQLYLAGDAAEPRRIGAAYRLAALSDSGTALDVLAAALHDERESVRRAATFGLVALGDKATDTFLAATESERKWLRKAGVFGLGDAADLAGPVLEAVRGRLAADPSVYVRSVAAHALGCLARRAVARDSGTELIPDCARALIESLGREANRLGMDRAQGRSIKFVRPTDDCDVCEGIGVDYGIHRYAPVRSAVRENALVSLVVLCSHGASVLGTALGDIIATLTQVIREDRNVFSVGLAMDALNRLLAEPAGRHPEIDRVREEAGAIFAASPIHCLPSLHRAGGHQVERSATATFGHY